MFRETMTDLFSPVLRNHCLSLLLGVLGIFYCGAVQADDRTAVEKLSVMGKREALPTRPGSAHVLSENELEKFDFNDIHRVLRQVPGVNVQEEDGFGLRPNIGLRGGHPHRSKKVTLLEDGVLIGPAPYSAPAAYYFPQMSKIAAVEVFKGVPSTAFGPNSIGGALNLITRMNEPGLRLGVQAGNYNSQQYNLSAGVATYGDFSFDLNHTKTQGFKELDNRDDTGFERNNLTFRWDKYFVTKDQNINFKFNWSDEKSNETYAGLTEQDFNSNPYYRYPGTERDTMNWVHNQFFLSYAISPVDSLRHRLTLYRHRYKRSWYKLNGFAGTNPNNPSQAIIDVLNNPDLAANNYYYQVISGQADSGVLSDDRDVLDLGNNQRQYLSQGVQFHTDYELDGFAWDHNFQLDYRFHQDQINRFHESDFFNMVSGRLVENTSRDQQVTALNKGAATANTLALTYEAQWEKLTIQSIVRGEDIQYEFDDYLNGTSSESSDHILAPGLGLFHQTFAKTGFLAGVNKGFTPTGPGQSPGVKPEEAINYELGVRHTGRVGLELIGFLSDYQNLLGTCTQSGGCTVGELDRSFNGGEAQVWGVEFLLQTDLKTRTMNFPIRWNFTHSQAQFKNSFSSALPEWGNGDVVSGDPIPYIPNWQSNLVVGWEWQDWSTYLNANYLGEMADQAVASGRRTIPGRIVFGAAVGWSFAPRSKLQLRLDNITNQEYVVSNRPFGLRPGRPFMAFVGVEHVFF